jgi:hypothetical protein
VAIDIKLKQEELRTHLSHEVNTTLHNEDCDRFLRARNYDVLKASDMVHKWAEWWNAPLPKTTEVALLPNNILITQEIDLKEKIYQDLLPHSNVGEDKEGRPIYWEKTGLSKFLIFNFVCISTIYDSFLHSFFSFSRN